MFAGCEKTVRVMHAIINNIWTYDEEGITQKQIRRLLTKRKSAGNDPVGDWRREKQISKLCEWELKSAEQKRRHNQSQAV
jgi:hypothetical protein